MANLKEIQGFSIQNLTEDPSPYAQALADNPYVGTWSSGGSLNTQRYRFGGATNATQSAGLVFGGFGSSPYGQTEEYNGTAWSEQNDLNAGRAASTGGGGTQTACITAGGYNPAGSPQYNTVLAEEYNGTSWTEVNDLNEGRIDCSTFGSSTAALLTGGGQASGGPGTVTSVESWNGTSWTETTDIPTATQEHASLGTSTAGLIWGGSVDSTPSQKNTTVEWNGSAWTAGGNYPIVANYSTSFGSQTDGIGAGGQSGSPNTSVAANYNGTSWTTVNSLATARQGISGNGTGTLGFVAGGYTTTEVTTTEEWTFTGLDPSSTPAVGYSDAIVGQVYYNSTTGQFKSITDGGAPIGAWSSAANINTARQHVGGIGTSNSPAVAFGGSVPPGSNLVESYDGTSWSEVNELNNGRTYPDGAGTATAGLAIGGAGGSTPATAGYVESWDGTNWTEVADLTRGPSSGPQSTVYGMGSGIQTSALYYGGDEGSSNTLAKTESWDGSSWTEVADLNQAKSYGAGIGTSNTSALAATGLDWAPGSSRNTPTNEEWNGSSWTELAETNTARGFLGCGNHGSVTSALIFGGRNQGPNAMIAATEFWNGTSWTEVSDLATARLNGLSGSGSGSNAMYAGGGTPSATAAAEEFTSVDFQIKTLTTS